MRNHKSYLGLTKSVLSDEKNNTGLVLNNPFIVISEIGIYDWLISWTYDVFVSTAHFDNEGNPVIDFRRECRLDKDEFEEFTSANGELLQSLHSRFYELVMPQPTVAAKLQSALFRTLDYRLDIAYEDGDRFPLCRLRNESYHQQVFNNQDVIAFNPQTGAPGLIPILHGVAAQKHSEFFEGTTLILPE